MMSELNLDEDSMTLATTVVDTWAQTKTDVPISERLDRLKFALAALFRDHAPQKPKGTMLIIERHDSGSVFVTLNGESRLLIDMVVKALHCHPTLVELFNRAVLIRSIESDFNDPIRGHNPNED